MKAAWTWWRKSGGEEEEEEEEGVVSGGFTGGRIMFFAAGTGRLASLSMVESQRHFYCCERGKMGIILQKTHETNRGNEF